MSIRKHWGDWLQQTVGVSKKGGGPDGTGTNYIQGYDQRGKLVKLTYTDKELDGLIESLVNVRRRNR